MQNYADIVVEDSSRGGQFIAWWDRQLIYAGYQINDVLLCSPYAELLYRKRFMGYFPMKISEIMVGLVVERHAILWSK